MLSTFPCIIKIGLFIFLIFLLLSYLSFNKNLTGKKGYLVFPASIIDVKGASKTIPAKLQSYLAMKKPVIGVIQGEGAKIIKESKCGIVQENGDYIELANQIRLMTQLSTEELIAMGENGRNLYNNVFSQNKRRDQILHLFE